MGFRKHIWFLSVFSLYHVAILHVDFVGKGRVHWECGEGREDTAAHTQQHLEKIPGKNPHDHVNGVRNKVEHLKLLSSCSYICLAEQERTQDLLLSHRARLGVPASSSSIYITCFRRTSKQAQEYGN